MAVSLDLFKRAEAGAPLSLTEHDANFSAIENVIAQISNELDARRLLVAGGQYLDLTGQSGTVAVTLESWHTVVAVYGVPTGPITLDIAVAFVGHEISLINWITAQAVSVLDEPEVAQTTVIQGNYSKRLHWNATKWVMVVPALPLYDAPTGDAAPSRVTALTASFVLTLASRLHNNVEVVSNRVGGVDFEVPADAIPFSKWYIRPFNDGCTVSVVGNVGSVNKTAGGSRRIINEGSVIVEVVSNPGNAPDVRVSGSVIEPSISVPGAKTYDNDDAKQDFKIVTGTQTFTAAANYADGFYCNLFREIAGNVTIAGVDANYTLVGPGAVMVKKEGTALMAIGSSGVVVLDAA